MTRLQANRIRSWKFATRTAATLIQLLDDKDSKVRKYTAEAIQTINSKVEAETTDEIDFDF